VIRSLNIWLAALLLFAAVCVGSSAQAQSDGKRIAVMRFTGPSAGAFQGQVTQGLKQRAEVELVATSEVQDTASRLGNSLSSDTEYREVGEALELSAFIEGNVVKKGKNLEATVRVRDAGSGAVVHEETWTRRRAQVKTLKPVVWGALGPAIAQTSPPAPKAQPKPTKSAPVAEPAPRPRSRPAKRLDEEEEEERARARKRGDDDEEERPRRADGKSARHPALVVAAGPQLMWRSLKYEGDTNFNNYKNKAGKPAINLGLSAQYYPGAHVSARWYSNVGLDLDLAYTMGLKSQQEDKATGKVKDYDTTAYELGIGAIWRFPLGAFEPRLRAGYFKQVFDVAVPEETTLLPSVDYSALRFGLGTAVHVADSVSLDVAFAYLFVLGTGDLEKPRFGEDVETSGWEAGAGVLLHIKEVYGLRLGLDYRRYSYDFGLSDSALRLPKSGSDGYLRLALTFVYALPGVSSP